MKIRPAYLITSVALLLIAVAATWYWQQAKPSGVAQAGEPTGNRADTGDFAAFNPSQPTSPAGHPDKVQIPLPSEGSIPGEYTVFFSDEASMKEFIEAAEAKGISVLGSIPDFLALRVGGNGSDLAALLKNGAEVDNNYLMEVPLMPSDEFWRDSGLVPFANGLLDYLGIPNTPERMTWGSGVTIAIIDTGYLEHSAINDKHVRSIDLMDSSIEGEYTGHGTAVAGMISSVNPFAPGVAPGADLLSIRVLDGNGKGDSFTLAEGILAAVENGADVINMSLGGYGDSRVLRQAVEYAVEQGVILVAASGNDGVNRLTYPAAYDSVIGVTAIDANDNRAPFANYGEHLDVAAPGFQIHALWTDDEYIYFNGTSASSPIVAAMAARILETDRAATPAEVYEVISSQANDTGLPGYDAQYGAGIISPERIEALGTTGIQDMALADLYPAIELSEGGSFPLYITLQNRGTDYIPAATVELSVNGTSYYYPFSGFDPGSVQSVQIPISEVDVSGPEPFKVNAKVVLPKGITDSRTDNNTGEITMKQDPEG